MTNVWSAEDAKWLETAPCGLMCTADDGVFLQANATFCGWIGQPREELIGKRPGQADPAPGGEVVASIDNPG